MNMETPRRRLGIPKLKKTHKLANLAKISVNSAGTTRNIGFVRNTPIHKAPMGQEHGEMPAMVPRRLRWVRRRGTISGKLLFPLLLQRIPFEKALLCHHGGVHNLKHKWLKMLSESHEIYYLIKVVRTGFNDILPRGKEKSIQNCY